MTTLYLSDKNTKESALPTYLNQWLWRGEIYRNLAKAFVNDEDFFYICPASEVVSVAYHSELMKTGKTLEDVALLLTRLPSGLIGIDLVLGEDPLTEYIHYRRLGLFLRPEEAIEIVLGHIEKRGGDVQKVDPDHLSVMERREGAIADAGHAEDFKLKVILEDGLRYIEEGGSKALYAIEDKTEEAPESNLATPSASDDPKDPKADTRQQNKEAFDRNMMYRYGMSLGADLSSGYDQGAITQIHDQENQETKKVKGPITVYQGLQKYTLDEKGKTTNVERMSEEEYEKMLHMRAVKALWGAKELAGYESIVRLWKKRQRDVDGVPQPDDKPKDQRRPEVVGATVKKLWGDMEPREALKFIEDGKRKIAEARSAKEDATLADHTHEYVKGYLSKMFEGLEVAAATHKQSSVCITDEPIKAGAWHRVEIMFYDRENTNGSGTLRRGGIQRLAVTSHLNTEGPKDDATNENE